MKYFLVILLITLAANFTYANERFIDNEDVEIWTESFGNRENEAILLIMGAGSSGLFWPDSLCHMLAENGYFVIRYDHRDTGKSSRIDYQKHPYTLYDLGDDALAVLDGYGIQKAHVIGASMGGFIGQILAANSPNRVLSFISVMSTPDTRPLLTSMTGEDPHSFPLPPPPQWATDFFAELKNTPVTCEEDLYNRHLKTWKVLSGEYGYDEDEFRELHERLNKHGDSPEAHFNHWAAMLSPINRTDLLKKISIPVLVIHGQKDIVLPIQHGIATANAIPGAKLRIIYSLGHTVCEYFVNDIVDEVIEFYDDLS